MTMDSDEEHPVIKVLIVDDNPDLCDLLRLAISSQSDIQITGILHRADGVLEEIERVRPDVLLIDLSMPGKNPLSVIREVSDQCPEIHSMAFSAHDDQQLINDAMAAGAAGYVSKMQGFRSLMTSVRQIAKGQTLKVTP